MIFNKRKTTPKSSEKRKAFSLVEISVVILIIGILIAGISQASDMIDEGALKAARTATNGSRVSRVRDLVLWLDATEDGASLTSANKQAAEGDDVAKWKDFNPNSINGFELTASGTPKYNANKTGGLPGIYFNGTNSYLKLSSNFDNSTGEYTIYLVYQPIALPASGAVGVIMEKRNATSAIFPYRLEIDSGGFYRYSNSNNFVVYGSKKASAGNVDLIRITRSSAGLVGLEVDSSPASGTSASLIRNNDELIIGAQNGSSISNYVNGRIGEVIIYERDLVASEKTDIENYLYKKWKLKKETSAVLGSCLIPSGATNVAVSSVPLGVTTAPCSAGFTGGPTLTCTAAAATAGTAATLTSGSCAAGCIIDSAIYTVASGNYTIAAGGASLSVTCRSDSTKARTATNCSSGAITYSGATCP